MPVYEFKCPRCGKVVEIPCSVDKMRTLVPGCPNCPDVARMKMKFPVVGVVWKCSRPTAYSAKDIDKKMSDVPDD